MNNPQPKSIKLSELQFDRNNANLGTSRGKELLEQSFTELGAGRSVLVDRNFTIIAGNKSVEAAAAAGLEDVIIVQTDGSKLIAIQRVDLSLDEDAKARTLALADNRIGEVSLNWSSEELAVQVEDLTIPLWNEQELQLITTDFDSLSIPSTLEEPAPSPKEKVEKKPKHECPQCGHKW